MPPEMPPEWTLAVATIAAFYILIFLLGIFTGISMRSKCKTPAIPPPPTPRRAWNQHKREIYRASVMSPPRSATAPHKQETGETDDG